MYNVQCSSFKALQNPPSHTAPFSQSDITRQRHVCRELQRERQHFYAFERHPALTLHLLDFYFHRLFGRTIQLLEQGIELFLQHVLQVREPVHCTVEPGIGPVILVAQSDPVAEVVAKGFVPGAEVVLLHVQFVDAHGRLATLEVQCPVGLREEMMEFLDAFVEAYEHGQSAFLFVLDEREAVVKAARFIVVVVEQVVLVASFGRHRAAEGGQFPGVYGCVELDGKESKFGHHKAGKGGGIFECNATGYFGKTSNQRKIFLISQDRRHFWEKQGTISL